MKSICGLDCDQCEWRDRCGGCSATQGKPFQGDCMLAVCCHGKGCDSCEQCACKPCALKQELMAEFNALGIEGMEEVTELFALGGFYINLEYALPSGQKVKFWKDERIYLGSQLPKKGSTRCYGLVADEKHLLVCEYGEAGADAEIVVFQRRG